MPDQPKEPEPRGTRGPTEEEIDALLKQYAQGAEKPETAGAPRPGGAPAAAGGAAKGSEPGPKGAGADPHPGAGEAVPAGFPPLGVEGAEKVEHSIEMLLDVPVKIRVELGRCRMQVQDILRLGRGAVVELDKLAGDALDIYVNDRLVARGEVLVQNQSFCVRITDIVNPKDRMKGPKA